MRPAFGRLIVLAAALLLQLAIYDRWIGILDEGFVLQTATEILRAKVLYRDVVIPAPFPGCFYLLAAVFRLFGPTLEVSRVLAASRQCQECVVKQLFRYQAGRVEGVGD